MSNKEESNRLRVISGQKVVPLTLVGVSESPRNRKSRIGSKANEGNLQS